MCDVRVGDIVVIGNPYRMGPTLGTGHRDQPDAWSGVIATVIGVSRSGDLYLCRGLVQVTDAMRAEPWCHDDVAIHVDRCSLACPTCKGSGTVPRKVWTQGRPVAGVHPAIQASRPAYRTIVTVACEACGGSGLTAVEKGDDRALGQRR
jgi:hypothetical protein